MYNHAVETNLTELTGASQPNLEIQAAFEIGKRITGIRDETLHLTAGRVRDAVLGHRSSGDYDFIGPIDLDSIAHKAGRSVLGRWDNLGVIKIRVGHADFDFIDSGKDIKKRLAINDIDISTLLLSQDGTVVDYFGGLESLNKKVIRMHNPALKIETDPSRILRVIRFAASLGFGIEENTLEAVIAKGHLLGKSDIVEDIWKIFGLNEQSRQTALDIMKQHQLNKHIHIPRKIRKEDCIAHKIECELNRIVPAKEIMEIFENGDFCLVGGSVRDVIWEKPIRDLDFKTNLTTEQMILALQSQGYIQTTDLDLSEGEYYVNQRTGSVSIFINGMDIDITHSSSLDAKYIYKHGDVNFSCGVYDIRTGKIKNPKQILEIKNKVLEFCNPEKAANDPLIVVNALKQISRDPSIYVPPSTLTLIKNSLPQVIAYFQSNPEMIYKLSSITGNLNSGYVRELFANYSGGKELFDNNSHLRKLKVSGSCISESLNELTPDNKQKLIRFIKEAFADHCDCSKIFCDKVTSVVYKIQDGSLVSCCLISGERIYAPAANCGQNWIEIVSNLIHHNYNIWMTVDASNLKIQALVSMAGLKVEHDPEVIKKILHYNDKKNPTDILVTERNGMTVFEKTDHPDYPQVLFRS